MAITLAFVLNRCLSDLANTIQAWHFTLPYIEKQKMDVWSRNSGLSCGIVLQVHT